MTIVLTENEARIIGLMRSLLPYENILILADKLGQPDQYIITRSSRVHLNEEGMKHIPYTFKQ